MTKNIPPQVDVERDKAPEEKLVPVWINNVPKPAPQSMENGGHLHRRDFEDDDWWDNVYGCFSGF